jgi:hypothetical protein
VIASISVLFPQDSCAIVSFSSAAQVVLPLTRMDPAGKRHANAVLRALQPEGSTNLWAGLEAALDVLRNEAGGASLSCVQVLTDGQPNVDPPNLAGHAASLRDYQARHGSRAAVHTFGFSYNINTELLEELAREGGGLFSFIPSPDMVATNFVNSAANFGAAAVAMPRLVALEEGGGGALAPAAGAPPLPAIAAGASVSVLLTRLPGGEPITAESLQRLRLAVEGAPLVAPAVAPPSRAARVRGALAAWRGRLVADLRAVRRKGMLGDLPGGLALVRALSESMHAAGEEEPALAEPLAGLLRDVEGQVAICLSKPEYFSSWGHAFLLSLARAHELQTCANFKDPGLQGYAGAAFRELQGAAETTFRAALAEAEAALPQGGGGQASGYPLAGPGGAAPGGAAPAARAPAAPLAALYNAAGGCVHGKGRVALRGGGETLVEALRVGDVVALAHPPGAVGAVTHIVRCALEPATHVVALKGGLLLTAWHPVRLPGGEWVFPARAPREAVAAAGTAAMFGLTHVFSIAVARADGYGFVVDGTPAITLGHGVEGHDVLTHAYYGTERVIRDVEAVVGAAGGEVGLDEYEWTVDKATGATNGLRKRQPQDAAAAAAAGGGAGGGGGWPRAAVPVH